MTLNRSVSETLSEPVRRSGDWHLHTAYTDGAGTVASYCEQAVANDLELLVFSEHTRRTLDYDYEALRTDVERARKRFDIRVLLGCEAKVLDSDGRLDGSPAVREMADVVTGVFHRFPKESKTAYLEAAQAMLSNPAVDIWGHPTLYAERSVFTLTDDDRDRLAQAAASNGVAVEYNQKYDLPSSSFVRAVARHGGDFVVGSDAHGVSDLLTKSRLEKAWAWLDRLC
jgi:histidinol phosphatase-like PHP family hydrolase